MPIETTCPACGRLLRVADEHAGRQARCPVCNHVYEVPSAAAQPVAPGGGPVQWRLRTPEGQIFGPTTKDMLDQWVDDGRVTAECQLQSDADDAWSPASQLYPQLRPAASNVGRGNPFAADPRSGPVGFDGAAAYTNVAGPRRYQSEHRGAMVLIMGLLGFIVCPIFSFVAWTLGAADLREMNQGRMDPDGRGLTQAGMILGMINSVLFLLTMLFIVFIFLMAVAAGA